MKGSMMIIGMTMFYFSAMAQKENSAIVKGNEAYRAKEYSKAGDQYRKALEQSPGNNVANFNLGNTLFRDNMGDKAIAQFDAAAKGSTETIAKADAIYNKGVVYSSQKKLPESIDAYKAALRLNPGDSLARQNLQRALNEQKKQQDQNKQKQQQKKPDKLNKQQVMQMLAALQEQEKLLQQRLNRSKVPSPTQPGKDW
ncbi:MAG TPA: tetratricopeptide repeat protein [Chitinophagaceae bacterium]|nr:tetratricopeptide repeat protein [Chitinophagaceae bacterium]